MLTPRFIELLADPPMKKKFLAQKVGWRAEDYSRFVASAQAIARRDASLVKLAELLGLRRDEAFL